MTRQRSKTRWRRHQRPRAEAAKKRNEEWAKLSPAEQLAALDERLGEGVGAVKQRRRLQEKLSG